MVIQGSRSVEERLGDLSESVAALTRRVEELSLRLDAMTGMAPALGAAPADAGAGGPAAEPVPSVEKWVGQSSLLSRIAMVSFVLVVALVLRTLTDSQIVGVGVGVVLGLAYSALLVAIGCWLLARGLRGQRVLPVCGAVLLCSIALEAHRKFQIVSADKVHWILLADLLAVGALGLRFRMDSIVAVAVLAPVVSALTVGFPNLQFPLVALLFLAANGMALLARRVVRLEWLAWGTFFPTLFFWLCWSWKANAHLRHPGTPGADGLAVAWFLPWLAAFVAFYALAAAVRTYAAPRSPGSFHAFVPAGNAMWAHPAALAVAIPGGGLAGIGGIALGAAVAHFAFAAWLWRRLRGQAIGITTFTLAGVLLLALGVATLAPSLALAAAVLAAVALGLARFASASRSPGLRLTALLLQVAMGAAAVAGGLYAVPSTSPGIHLGAAVVVVVFASWHYLHDFRHTPPAGSWYAYVDAKNRASILLLWSATAAGFGMLRVLLDRFLLWLGAASPHAFLCGQSVLLNLASIALLLWGLRAANRQALLTAVLVAACGGLKVFGADMLEARGVPLVLSVFSFGLAAAVASVVLGRLQRGNAGPGQGPPAARSRPGARPLPVYTALRAFVLRLRAVSVSLPNGRHGPPAAEPRAAGRRAP
ncbi:MAG: hypothetical protein FJ265_02380 [Planctomycetes bacterium]|nr:hypothetical protein [Planctomycetota bacterium]